MRISHSSRSGITLMEVVLSVVIFFISIGALSQLYMLGADLSIRAKFRQEGVQLAKSKLAEFAAGLYPMEGVADQGFDVETDDEIGANWTWSCEAQPIQQESPMLWNVKISVQRDREYGPPIVIVMNQLILDPADRGSTLDPPPIKADEEEGGEDPEAEPEEGGEAPANNNGGN